MSIEIIGLRFTHRKSIKPSLYGPFFNYFGGGILRYYLQNICSNMPTGICKGGYSIYLGDARKIRTFVSCLYEERKTNQVRSIRAYCFANHWFSTCCTTLPIWKSRTDGRIYDERIAEHTIMLYELAMSSRRLSQYAVDVSIGGRGQKDRWKKAVIKERQDGKGVEGVGKEVIGSRDDEKKIENEVNDTRGAVNRKEVGTK